MRFISKLVVLLICINPLIVNAKISSTSYMERAGQKYIFKIGELIGPQAEMYQENERKFDVENNSTIKDVRNKIIDYLDKNFKGNENFKKIINSSAFCSENNNIISDNYKITSNEKIAIIPPLGGG